MVPGNQPIMGESLEADTIDYSGFERERTNDILKVFGDIVQKVHFRRDGSGVLRDESRGKMHFKYAFTCDTLKPEAQLIDSAGYYVESGSPLIPCELKIANATYRLLREQTCSLRDSLWLSREQYLGAVSVVRLPFLMIRER